MSAILFLLRAVERLVKALLRIAFWSLLVLAALAMLVGWALWREVSGDLPPVAQLLDYRPPAATRVYAADGTQIGEFYVERRYLVSIDRVPEHVRLAFIAAEDADFYHHGGVDLASIGRAMRANLERGDIVQGASTITQQVVKQLLLSPERSFERKLKEVVLAVELETKLSKDEILYLYLNHIYFGAGTYGISAAAQQYFGREVPDLSLAEAAMLAGLPQAPSRHDPLRRPSAARRRQRYVLDRMVEVGFITEAQRDAALAEPLDVHRQAPPTYGAAPWYVEHVRRLLEQQYGPEFADLGLHVETAADLRLQTAAEETLRDGLRRVERRLGRRLALRHLQPNRVEAYLERQRRSGAPGGLQQAVVTGVLNDRLEIRTPWEPGVLPRDSETLRAGDVVFVDPVERGDDGVMRYALNQDPLVEGAMVVIEPETGLVKALVGGVNFRRSQFNRAVQAQRQPGSAFKPFIYAAAIDKGYTATTIVTDAPVSLPDGRGGRWSPKNFHDKYMGRVPLRTALAESLNTVSVRLALDVGIDRLRQYLSIFGFPTQFPRNYSLALGTSEVTPFELTRAYGVFAAHGRRFEPVFVTGVYDANGDPVDFPGARPHFEPVMRPATAYIVARMLQEVVETGTASAARALGRPSAGKTGTTNESKDAWFIGFTPELLASVWVGYDADRALGSLTGGGAATPIWTEFMQRALADQPQRDFAPPADVTLVQVDTATGLKAVPGRASREEAFVAGTEPQGFAPRPIRSTPAPGDPAAATTAADAMR
jgi:penicillin-binding protein 1A